MQQLLVATNNKGKQAEIRALLGDLAVVFTTPDQLQLAVVAKEDGRTYKENASKKAMAYVKSLPKDYMGLILADDSGLEVDVLNGQPGLHSARFSPKPGATDADRRAYLLARLVVYPRPWLARFRCVVALYDPSSGFHYAEGICPGEITPEERGENGFGYDPIFLVENLDRTMAELTMEAKNLRSHRGRAILAIRPKLVEILNR